MKDIDIDGWIALSERKKDFWVGGLFGLWFMINFNTLAIIQFFISQQSSPPYTRAGMTGIFPYIFILTPGIWVILLIYKRSLPICIEIILIFGMFIISFSLSGQETRYIDHFIRISELKSLCYQTLSTLINTSQFLLLPIWYIVRFMKVTPHEINTRILGVGVLACIFMGGFSELIYDILKAIHLFPYIV